MIEINKGYQHPLAIFRAEFKNIDNPEDPEVLYFEPRIHKIRTLELQIRRKIFESVVRE